MAAKSGFPFLLQRESGTPGTYTTVTLARDISGPTLSINPIDVTHKGSTDRVKEYIGGLIEGGEIAMNILYDSQNVTHKSITTDFKARTVANWRLLFSETTEYITFIGMVQSFTPAGPTDGAMTADIVVKVSGTYTITTV